MYRPSMLLHVAGLTRPSVPHVQALHLATTCWHWREGRSMLIEMILETTRFRSRSMNSNSPLEEEISGNTPCTDRHRSKKRSETGPPLYLQFLYCYVYLNFCFTFSFCCIILSVYKNRLYCSSHENRIGYIVSYKWISTFVELGVCQSSWKCRILTINFFFGICIFVLFNFIYY